MTTNVSKRDEFPTFFSVIFGGKTNLAEFFTRSFRDNPSVNELSDVRVYSQGII